MQIRGYHIVQPGDSLASIANNYGITQDQLLKTNKMISPLPAVGQRLAIPFPNATRQKVYRPVTAYTVTEPIL